MKPTFAGGLDPAAIAEFSGEFNRRRENGEPDS